MAIPAPIVLDTTLRDLYAAEGAGDNIALVYAVPTAEVPMSSGVPLSTKFAYQSPACPTNDGDTLAREFLQLVPQLFGFVAGKMPLFMFDLDPNPLEEGYERPHQSDARRVLGRLTPLQQPELEFVAKPGDIKSKDRVAIVNPMDCLGSLTHLVDPEAHYEALSKRGLAYSGLPTPETEVVDTVLGPAQISDGELVDFEVERMMECIRRRELPFVIKMPQSLSGQGTFIVRSETDRQEAIKTLIPETRRMLHQINLENAHMNPCSLILQRMTPGEAVALSLFINKSGRATFIACCPQLVDGEGNWGGGYCDYREQDALKAQYAETAEKLGIYLHKLGYWGPMGADVMIDDEGRQVVIDMNVRVTGSYPLGMLRGHFQKRGLSVAVLFFPLMLSLTWEEFKVHFREELDYGSLVINAWVHMKDGATSMTTVTLAAADKEKLNKFVERVNVFKLKE